MSFTSRAVAFAVAAGAGLAPLAAQPYTVVHGIASDFFVPGEFDRDGRADPGIWRSGAAVTAQFLNLRSATSRQRIVFGQTGDDPTVPGDYDGDGIGDAAVYRGGASAGQPSHWIYKPSGGGAVVDVVWGQNGDFPAPGDYDGDGRMDFAVQRTHAGPACAPVGPPQDITPNADFLIKYSSGIPDQTITCFGRNTDVIVPGDYDNDGITDLIVIRGVAGEIVWTVRRSSNQVIVVTTFGASATDFPTPGDYDGDGRADFAIWRPSATPGQSKFMVRPASGAADFELPFGQNGDYPVANYNSH